MDGANGHTVQPVSVSCQLSAMLLTCPIGIEISFFLSGLRMENA